MDQIKIPSSDWWTRGVTKHQHSHSGNPFHPIASFTSILREPWAARENWAWEPQAAPPAHLGSTHRGPPRRSALTFPRVLDLVGVEELHENLEWPRLRFADVRSYLRSLAQVEGTQSFLK